MSRIHIARNRQPLGQFSPEEVATGLRTGRFRLDDLAWRDPMETWKPLSEFTDLPVDELPLTPPPLPTEAARTAPAGLPWEPRGTRSVFSALIETVRQIFSTPTEAFRRMPATGGHGSPLAFYLLLAVPCWWILLGYTTAALLVNPGALHDAFRDLPRQTLIANQAASALIAPFFLAGGAYLSAGIFHGVFRLLDATTKPFEATFRAFCYASGPAAIFLVVPICGSIIFFVVSMALLVIAVREVHRMDTLRATLGIVLPSVFCSLALLLAQSKLMAIAAQGSFR